MLSHLFIFNILPTVPTPIQSVEVVLGVSSDLDQDEIPESLANELDSLVRTLGGSVRMHQEQLARSTPGPMSVRFHIEGENKVDVAYRLEELVSKSFIIY